VDRVVKVIIDELNSVSSSSVGTFGELKVEMLEVYAYRAYAYTPQYSPICMLCK